MSGRKNLVDLGLDRLIHEKARLMILTYLSSSDSPETSFTEIRDALALSSGNLSIQLKTLEEAHYVTIEKSFKNNKPNTAVGLSVEGRRALDGYLNEMEVILATARSKLEEAT